MSAMELDVGIYEKILDFALLNPCTRDYYEQAVSLFKTNFSANLVAYSSWFNDGRLASCYSVGLSEHFMREAHNIYIHDEIRNFAIEQMSSNSWDGIFWSQDADPFTYAKSKTIQYHKENNISYFAVAVLSKEPRINLLLCKTEREGPFMQQEKEIIQRVCRLLSQQVLIRKAFNKDRNALKIINTHYSNKKTGLIIMDEKRTVLNYNESALSLIPKRLGFKNIDDIVSYVFSLFKDKANSETEQDEMEYTITRDGRFYTLEEITLVDMEGIPALYSLITVRKNRNYDNKVDPAVSAAYHLTERETGIAELLVSGFSNYDIADQMHISVHTVKIHVSNLFRKLNVHSRMEAVIKLSKKV